MGGCRGRGLRLPDENGGKSVHHLASPVFFSFVLWYFWLGLLPGVAIPLHSLICRQRNGYFGMGIAYLTFTRLQCFSLDFFGGLIEMLVIVSNTGRNEK